MTEVGPELERLYTFIPDSKLEPTWSPGKEGKVNTEFLVKFLLNKFTQGHLVV